MGPNREEGKGPERTPEPLTFEIVIGSTSQEPLRDLTFSVPVDSSIGDHTVIESRCPPDSPDDLLAAHFPILDRESPELFRARIGLLIEKIRPAVERSSGIGPIEESIETRDLSFRSGTPRFCFERGPIVWIECRCEDSGAYLLPDLSGQLGEGGHDSRRESFEVPPECFFDGYARLVLHFDRNVVEPVAVTPWLSDECALEAETHFVRALRGGGDLGASFLLNQYRVLLVSEAVKIDLLEESSPPEKRHDFVEALGIPTITSIGTEENGDVTYSLEYRDCDGGGVDAPTEIPRVHLVRISRVAPWGLAVVDVRFIW